MDVGDCSLWHHLIFCEELQNDEENHEEPERHPLQNEETESEEENEETESDDGNNQVVCWVCKEPVLGHPAYKCLECNFLQHKSCIDPTPTTEMQVEHDLGKRHHLMFTVSEEVGNITGNEEQVCPGCEEPVFGPAYKCSIPGCKFLLHKLCTDLPHVIQHPMHSKHTLILRVPSDNDYCDACLEYCSRCFFYRCSLCNYDLDVKCRSRWRINADNCHQHAFVATSTQIQFTCQVCGEERKDIAYLCSICKLLIHLKCARFRRTVEILTHNHSLTLTYSLPQFKDHDIFCKLCYEKVNTEYATYSCQECCYIAHLNCTIEFKRIQKDIGLQRRFFKCDTNLVHLVEGIKLAEDERAGPREINHFSHPQHYLILIDEELMENKRCEACMQFIICVPFYGCVKCNFFLHNRCAKLPSTIQRWGFDDHPLTLLSKALSTDGLFWCVFVNVIVMASPIDVTSVRRTLTFNVV
jgi:hypothetical protein